MQLKFKSGVNIWIKFLIAVLNIIILMLFCAKFFIDSFITIKFGIALFVIEALLILPMPYFTYYEFKEDYLYIHDYPFRYFKIKYKDIFDVEDGDFETKNKNIVALSLDRIVICYKTINKDEEEEKKYIYISPKDMSLFLIRLSARLQKNKVDIEEKAKEISLKQKEHELKKKIAEEKKKAEKKANEPDVIKISGSAKNVSFKVSEENEETDGENN